MNELDGVGKSPEASVLWGNQSSRQGFLRWVLPGETTPVGDRPWAEREGRPPNTLARREGI